MKTLQISKCTYEVKVYDWVELSDDYVCGYIMREPDADEDSDLRYWMFYPADEKPIMAGDLKQIYMFISELNKVLRDLSLYN